MPDFSFPSQRKGVEISSDTELVALFPGIGRLTHSGQMVGPSFDTALSGRADNVLLGSEIMESISLWIYTREWV